MAASLTRAIGRAVRSGQACVCLGSVDRGLRLEEKNHPCSRLAARIGKTCPDNQIGKTVTIDISGASDRPAAAVIHCCAVEAKAVAAIERRQLDDGWKPTGEGNWRPRRRGQNCEGEYFS